MIQLLITDVDNTLLDWQHLWFQSFSSMSNKVIEISQVDAERYYSECSIIHQKYGSSEYSQLLGELPCLRELYGDNVVARMQPAIDAYREARRQHLRLFDGVRETLAYLKERGIVTAAYTESMAFYTSYRFRKLGLDGLIDFLYSPPDHDLPTSPASIRRYEASNYELKHTLHRFTPKGEAKPNPHILATIVAELGFTRKDVIYVGDNLLKNVFMAQEAGIVDVYAAYGAAQNRKEQYDLLKRVTHWTPEMVAREQAALRPGAIEPTYTLGSSFAEIISVIGN